MQCLSALRTARTRALGPVTSIFRLPKNTNAVPHQLHPLSLATTSQFSTSTPLQARKKDRAKRDMRIGTPDSSNTRWSPRLLTVSQSSSATTFPTRSRRAPFASPVYDHFVTGPFIEPGNYTRRRNAARKRWSLKDSTIVCGTRARR